MQQLSVVIITYNEARNLRRCINSLGDIAAEVIVLDSFSTDDTIAIARELGASTRLMKFTDYVTQKNKAVSLATHNWVLNIDADEVLSGELRSSILEVLEKPEFPAYACNRKTNYCGKWVRYSGWYPDRKVRLFDKTHGKWEGQQIHEYWKLNDPQQKTGALRGDLLHYSYPTLSDHMRKIDAFSEIQARVMAGKGKFPGALKLIIKPSWTFFATYILKRGFLDGSTGLTIAVMSAYANFMKLAKARQLSKRSQAPGVREAAHPPVLQDC